MGRTPRLTLQALGAGVRFDRSSQNDRGAYLLALKKDPCALCGRLPEFRGHNSHGRARFSGELDHIQPKLRRAHTTSTEWENLTGMCVDCNAAKGSMSLLGYLLAKDVMTVGVPPGELVISRFRAREGL